MDNTTFSHNRNKVPSVPPVAVPVQAFDLMAAVAAAEVAPRSSNTGAQNTVDVLEGVVPLSWEYQGFLIDWLRFTVTDDIQQQKMLSLWRDEPENWSDMDSGHMGYRKCYRSAGIAIYYDHSEPGRGICFDISGKGCRALEETKKISVGAGWLNILRTLTETEGVNITRLDVALDDKRGLVDMDKVQDCIDSGEVVSRFKSAFCIEKKSLATGKGFGKTANFGSRISDMMVRIYDKHKQMQLKDKSTWVRVELESKDENAVALARLMAAAGAHNAGSVVSGVLRNYVTFRVKQDGDTNKSRWPMAAWWDEFLRGVEAERLAVAKSLPTVERLRGWLEKQVVPTLAALFSRETGCYGRSLLDAMIDDGQKRLRPKHHDMLRREKARVALVAPPGGATGF